jgi:hypothetical protein
VDELQRSHIKQTLIVAQSAINDALAELAAADGAPVSAGVMLPGGGRSCRHERAVFSMGGYWNCPDCHASGRKED